jgi:ferric-dicitrate binding protein FerR (iron transport regulator)
MPERNATLDEISAIRKRMRRNKITRLIPATVAAAACVALVIVVFLWQFDNSATLLPEQNEAWLTYYTEPGVKSSVALPDGSQVIMNSVGRISFPASFSGRYRDVTFEGEGYFKVDSNPSWPMRIITGDGNVQLEVVGTEFNLSSYADDYTVTTTLYSGSVVVQTKDASGHVTITEMKPSETLIINKYVTQQTMPVKTESQNDVEMSAHDAWTRGELIFDDELMADVIKKLKRWHGVDFVVKDNNILSRRLTAKFGAESVQQIMEMTHLATGINWSMKDNTVTLYN